MIDRALDEAPARRQTGVAGSDDDRRDVFDGLTPRRLNLRQATAVRRAYAEPALYILPGPLRGPRPTD